MVGAVHVLEHDQHGCVVETRQRGRDRLEAAEPFSLGIGAFRLLQRRADPERLEHRSPRPVRRRAVLLGRPSPQHPLPGGRGPVGENRHEPALADAGLTSDEHDPPADRRVEPPGQCRQLAVAPDEARVHAGTVVPQ